MIKTTIKICSFLLLLEWVNAQYTNMCCQAIQENKILVSISVVSRVDGVSQIFNIIDWLTPLLSLSIWIIHTKVRTGINRTLPFWLNMSHKV